MTVLEQMAACIQKHGMATPETPVLLMVSGGSDSAAMAYLAAGLQANGVLGPVAMLHVNHQLRPAGAEEDQAFVEALAQSLDIPLFSCRIDIPRLVDEENGNMEAIARRERYAAANEALQSMCNHFGVPFSRGAIFVAHTQNDRVENFYMRSIVGTGPGGFRSMDYKNGNVMRPLLDVSRQDLQNIIIDLNNNGLNCVKTNDGNLWCEDVTNQDTNHFRAYVRKVMVPAALEKNPALLDTLCRTMNLIADDDDYVEQQSLKLEETGVQWVTSLPGLTPDYSDGFTLLPEFGSAAPALKRRVILRCLKNILGEEARIETASIQKILECFNNDGTPKSGAVANIQGDLAVSSNKHGVLVEPMVYFRARRKK